MVWDWPLRIWHWAFASALIVSLYTGLAGQIHLMDTHLISGQVVLVLLMFRLAWGLWGGRHARFGSYVHALTAGRRSDVAAHTRPGALMAMGVWLIAATQAGSGLFSSDDIFTEGPFVRHVSDATIDLAGSVHHRAFWLIIALAVGHVVAVAWYGAWRKDSLALAMFNGRKAGPDPDPGAYLLRGVATALGAAGLWYLILWIY